MATTSASRKLRLRLGQVIDGSRALGDGSLDLPCFRIADTHIRESVAKADLDYGYAGRTDGVIVGVALAAHGDDFILHPPDVRQPAHLGRIHAGNASRGPYQKAGGGACRDTAGLGIGNLRDDLARRHLKLGDVDTELGRFAHRVGDFSRHYSAAKTSHGRVGIDDRSNPELLVDVSALIFRIFHCANSGSSRLRTRLIAVRCFSA